MKLWKNVVVVVAAVGATTLLTERVVSQDYQKKIEKKAGEIAGQLGELGQLGQDAQDGQDEYQAQMEAWMKYGEPGPQHARMAKWVGKWQQETTHYVPGAEPETSTSNVKYKSMFGGRFVTQHMSGKMSFMGEEHAFEGFGLHGYDNLKEKYFFAWVDNFGTMMMTAEGEEDETGAIVYHSTMPNPVDGSAQKVKSISRELSEDKTAFEMHMQMPDGNWFKSMEMIATRK